MINCDIALAVRCHYIRAAFLVANDKYRGSIHDKFSFFNTHFPDVLSKEEFRRKVKTFCSFVAKKMFVEAVFEKNTSKNMGLMYGMAWKTVKNWNTRYYVLSVPKMN